MRLLLVLLAATMITLSASSAKAFDIDFGLGYSKLQIDGSSDDAKALDGSDGPAFDISFKFTSIIPGLRWGFGVQGSYFRDEYHVTNSDGDSDKRFRDLTLIIPEFRVGYHVPIGPIFIEPSMGAALVMGEFRTGYVDSHHGNEFDDSDHEEFEVNVALTPRLQAGIEGHFWAAGLEVSWMNSHLDFGDGVGGDISTFYGGAFFRISFF